MNRKEFYESLSDELKEKIKACRSEEEMRRVLEDAQIDLSSELLDEVSGGAYKKMDPSVKPCADNSCWCD